MAAIMKENGRKTDAGYSLVEVMISLGLMSGVLVAICSMFVLGGTTVKAGKTLTQATVLAQDIMEEIDKQSYSGVYQLLQGATPDPNATTVVSDTRVSTDVADTLWGDKIRSDLHKGYAVVEVTPLGGTATPTTFGTGEAIRINLEIGWTDLRRDRNLTFESIRF